MKVSDDSDLELTGLSPTDRATYWLFMTFGRQNVLTSAGLLMMSFAAALIGPTLFAGDGPVMIRGGFRAFLAIAIFVGFGLMVVGLVAELALRGRIRRLSAAEDAAIEFRLDAIMSGEGEIPAGLSATEPVVVSEDPVR